MRPVILFVLIISAIPDAVLCSGVEIVKSTDGPGSALIQLGTACDFAKVGKALLANPRAWGKAGKQGRVSYRILKPKAQAELLFAAFDTDKDGFCRHDMVLEIFYRDDVKQQSISKYKVKGKVAVNSRIDFARDNEYVEAGHLEADGDGSWKTARIFLERTPRQLLRAIDGSFQFKIVMPPESSRPLPVCSVGLISMGHQEFVQLREQDRKERGLKRVDYKCVSDAVIAAGEHRKRGFVVHPANYLKLVFPNSAVHYDVAGSRLQCFEIPGQAEPVAFVIHALEDLSDVHIEVSDLHCGMNAIPADMIRICQVVYNDQRWGWERAKEYGTCPDYLLPSPQTISIKRGISQPFWLTISVPVDARAGFYDGKVTILAKHKNAYTIGLRVEVLPVKLLEKQVQHIVYHSPYFKAFHRDPQKVLQDMKSHGLVPVFYPKGQLITTLSGDLSIRLSAFEYELQRFRQVYPVVDTIFVGLFNYGRVWGRLKGPNPAWQRAFPQFELVYGKILSKYANLATKYGLEVAFSFTDEPNVNPTLRRISYLCSRIAKQNGLKTWCTYLPYADRQLSLTTQELSENVNYLRPLSEVLDVFVCGIWAIDTATLRKYEKYNNLAYYTTYLGTSIRPVYNRFLHGIYPFVIGSRCVLAYAYRDSILDPYDDLDYRKQEKDITGLNDFVLTYPTWQGDILPTLSYEALREGVEDSRLISTLRTLSDKARRAKNPDVVQFGKEAEDYLAGMLKRVSKNFKQRYWQRHNDLPVDPMEKNILRDLNNGQSEDYQIFDKIRRCICDRIIALQNALYQ